MPLMLGSSLFSPCPRRNLQRENALATLELNGSQSNSSASSAPKDGPRLGTATTPRPDQHPSWCANIPPSPHNATTTLRSTIGDLSNTEPPISHCYRGTFCWPFSETALATYTGCIASLHRSQGRLGWGLGAFQVAKTLKEMQISQQYQHITNVSHKAQTIHFEP